MSSTINLLMVCLFLLSFYSLCPTIQPVEGVTRLFPENLFLISYMRFSEDIHWTVADSWFLTATHIQDPINKRIDSFFSFTILLVVGCLGTSIFFQFMIRDSQRLMENAFIGLFLFLGRCLGIKERKGINKHWISILFFLWDVQSVVIERER